MRELHLTPSGRGSDSYGVDADECATPCFPDFRTDFPGYVAAMRAFARARLSAAMAKIGTPDRIGPDTAFSLFDLTVAALLGSERERPFKQGTYYSWEMAPGWLDYVRLPIVLPLVAASVFTPGQCALAAQTFKGAAASQTRDCASFARARDVLMLAGSGTNACLALCLQGGAYWHASPAGTIQAFNRGHAATARHRDFVANLRCLTVKGVPPNPIVPPPAWPRLTWPTAPNAGLSGPLPGAHGGAIEGDDDDDGGVC